jgi:ATP-binding cassette subfamily B protein
MWPSEAAAITPCEVVKKLLSLPLGFYDENNPGRIAGRVARGLVQPHLDLSRNRGTVVPKLVRVAGIFCIIAIIDWRIAGLFFLSFVAILAFSMRDLIRLNRKEQALDKYMETTESRTSEIITNIKTVKAFATEHDELARQRQRLSRELTVVEQIIHRGYVVLMTWQELFIQTCVFGVLVLTMVATLRGQISLGHFVTTLTVSSMAYAELEPISNLAEIFARRYASMLRFHEFLQQPTGIEAASVAGHTRSGHPLPVHRQGAFRPSELWL